MGKKEDYDPKVPGQQLEEIQDAQRKYRQQRDFDIPIEKSKQRDKQELKQLGDEAHEKFRQSKANENQDEQ